MIQRMLSNIMLTVLMVLLFAVSPLARNKASGNQKQPVKTKQDTSIHESREKARQRAPSMPDTPEFDEKAKTERTFVPAALATAPNLGSSGLFNGIFAGNTRYDYQHNGTQSRMVQTGLASGDRYAHVTWMVLKVDDASSNDRQVNYNCYNWTTESWSLSTDPYGGQALTSAGERGGYTCLDVNSDGLAVVFYHANLTSRVARFAIPGLGIFSADYLSHLGAQADIWPHGSVGHSSAVNGDVYHVGAKDSNPSVSAPAVLVYWRYYHNGGDWVWDGPVAMDSAMTVSQLVLADSNRVVYVFGKPRTYVEIDRDSYNNDMAYYESTTSGADWITNGGPDPSWESGGAYNCTDYADSDPHRFWSDLAGGFDSEKRLHLVYNNPEYNPTTGESFAHCDLLHWNEGTAGSNENANASGGTAEGFVGGTEEHFHTIARADWWDNSGLTGVWNSHIAMMSIAFGDGSTTCNSEPNTDYLYVVYTQFGSPNPDDQADASAAGYQNGNLWLSISNNLGVHWAPQLCITTTDGSVGGTPTRSPGCDVTVNDTCLSEHWSSAASTVNDTLHVFYIGDLDAGAIPFGEGNWAINDVMYYPIFGGTDGDLCPVIEPAVYATITSDPNCEYYSDLEEPINLEDLTIGNIGNTTLNYSVAVDYLSGSGWITFTGHGGSIPSTNILPNDPDDVYEVQMNGTSLDNGVYQAQIQITHDGTNTTSPYNFAINFFRADTFVCGTDTVVTTPKVALEISNVGSYAHEGRTGLRYYNEASEDSFFNPVYDASITIANKTLTGGNDTVVYRNIFANQTPSNPGYRASSELELSFNAATNESVATAQIVTVDSTIGVGTEYRFPQDADSAEMVLLRYSIYPRDAGGQELIIGVTVDFDCLSSTDIDNLGGYIANYNLLYQHGTDTARNGGFYYTSNKYAAGVSALMYPAPKYATIQNNIDHVYPNNGFSDQFIYEQLDAIGGEIWADSAEDILSILALEEITLGAGQTYFYDLALVSSIAAQTGVPAALYAFPYDIYVADLIATTAKAWKKAFGWRHIGADPGSEVNGINGIIDLIACGTHEDGRGGGCCGCSFSILDIDPAPASDEPYIVDNGNCTGFLYFDMVAEGSYTITIRVEDLCGDQSDDHQVSVNVVWPCDCGESWGDITGDLMVNVLEMVYMMDFVFRGLDSRVLPLNCPNEAGDYNCDGSVNPLDVVYVYRYIFYGSPPPCADPCD